MTDIMEPSVAASARAVFTFMYGEGLTKLFDKWSHYGPDTEEAANMMAKAIGAARAALSTPAAKREEGKESLFDEFLRLVTDYDEADENDPTKAEGWNLIADFAFENRGRILSAISRLSAAKPGDEAVRAAYEEMAKRGLYHEIAVMKDALSASPQAALETKRTA